MELTTETIRILIVDDHPMVIAGIKTFLAEYPHIRIIGEAGNGKEAIERAKTSLPDIILMDISMPVMNGLDATRAVMKHFPTIDVIILTMHDDREYIRQIFQCGAKGYVLKNAPQDDILRAIEAVYKGNAFFSPEAAKVILELAAEKETNTTSEPPAELTDVEKDIIVLIVQELSNKEIADKLYLSLRTVEKYRQTIMQKLNIHNTIALTKFAIRNGLVKV
ncbi:MAG: response regulator transcription factor [Ignavibacteriae bacterium]|nr:response regulator transcription factor [Ignavibacteriota bacterium]